MLQSRINELQSLLELVYDLIDPKELNEKDKKIYNEGTITLHLVIEREQYKLDNK